MASLPRQNKQRGSALVIILAIAALVVTGGAIAYVLLSKGGGKENSLNLGSIGQKTITAVTSSEVKTLLTDAKAGKYDATCTYKDENGDGTIYISGSDKMRVDTTISKKPGHLLGLGGSAYIWADGQTEGSKLPLSKESSTGSKYSPESFAGKVDQYHVTCRSVGHLDASLFTIPKGINFVDVNSQTHSYSSSPQ